MKTPTQKQIDAEIKTLESYRGKIPPGTLTDNKAALEAQIDVLQNKLSQDAIFDRWPDDERDCEIRCNALDAHDWMRGENGKGKPSKEWKELVS
jgi:hypothetical protein